MMNVQKVPNQLWLIKKGLEELRARKWTRISQMLHAKTVIDPATVNPTATPREVARKVRDQDRGRDHSHSG